jgi:LmbE family N-acetylglucosaminyl deacetylase
MNYKNVLILAPHTDDGELGCGGTIVKLLEEGSNVYYAAFSTAEQSLPEGLSKDTLKNEVRNATRVIGIPSQNLFIYSYEVRKLNYVRQEILEELIRLKSKISFDLIFMPSLHDIHQDHTTIANEGLRAFKTSDPRSRRQRQGSPHACGLQCSAPGWRHHR